MKIAATAALKAAALCLNLSNYEEQGCGVEKSQRLAATK